MSITCFTFSPDASEIVRVYQVNYQVNYQGRPTTDSFLVMSANKVTTFYRHQDPFVIKDRYGIRGNKEPPISTHTGIVLVCVPTRDYMFSTETIQQQTLNIAASRSRGMYIRVNLDDIDPGLRYDYINALGRL